MKRALPIICLLLCACADDAVSHDEAAHGDGDHTHDVGEALATDILSAQSSATVLYVGEDGDFLTLDHADIPEINMGAMRMGFDVVEGVDISTLSEGDEILFDLEAGDSIGIRVTDFCVPARDGADCLD